MKRLQLFTFALFVAVIAGGVAFAIPVWATTLALLCVVALQIVLEVRHFRHTGKVCGSGSLKALSVTGAVVLALAMSGGTADADVKLSRKGCALQAKDCSLLIENSKMYNAVYDGTSTMYSFPQNSIRTRLERWLNAYVVRLEDCKTPKEKVHQIIGHVKSYENTYDILAPYHAVPGSVCYIRKSRG